MFGDPVGYQGILRDSIGCLGILTGLLFGIFMDSKGFDGIKTLQQPQRCSTLFGHSNTSAVIY